MKSHLAIALNLLLLPLGLTACQTTAFDPDSPLSRLPSQSILTLHQELNIPANTVSLWFQQGKQVPEKLLDRYQPFCKFETLKMQPNIKRIQPDRFLIHKVLRWDDYAMINIKLASVGIGFGGFGIDSDPSPVNMATEMFLHSEQQQDVYRLVCSHWEDAATGEHVTINQMRQTLGKYFSLEIPVKALGK